ncbi:cellulose biosynthesis protein BcsE [Entomohabitans teleogrylli]|uniref:cellulose biosynthesis protein BcsE n=1 Tax=Entomohabitans teleogrylli TaxID=1384589 RepID=UPI00073D522B|nr:cellulose biosynthesis protein BcsE [Entomohabitans teleogrylli]
MSPVFSIGIRSLWDELRHVQTGGVWWINVDRRQDAISLVNRTLAAQTSTARVAVITMGEKPQLLINLDSQQGPESIQAFTMPATWPAHQALATDILCNIDPENTLIILVGAENAYENIAGDKLTDWLEKIARWTKVYNCGFLIVNTGHNTDRQSWLLIGEYRNLSGLASLRYQGDDYVYDIAWWSNQLGVSARQQLTLTRRDGDLTLAETTAVAPRSRDDEKAILSHHAVLEGAPPLSEYWQLFDGNEALFDAARSAQAATIIFSLNQNNQIEGLAQDIHTLRRQRGSALKIIVRERSPSLRATDERLLLGCGANMVIPWNTPLSRSLSLIESVQGQQFSRHVPEDIDILMRAMKPLVLKGYQPWETFCNLLTDLMNNPLVPADSKGVLVALRPTPGLRVEQALTLCRPNRQGDIVTIGDNKMYLFLSFCRINDLDTALKHIFPLPVGDVVSNRTVWYEDSQISAELNQMRYVKEEQRTQPLPQTIGKSEAMNVHYDGKQWRRIPEPVTLLSDQKGAQAHHESQ